MFGFIVKRLGEAIPVLFAVMTLTFFFVRMAPGGPFDQERALDPVVKKNLEVFYHLDEPLIDQYARYVKQLVFHFDFGPSSRFPSRTVTELMAAGFPVTLELGLYAILFALFLGVLSGVLASKNPNSLHDHVPMSISMIGICVPSFLLGPLLALIFGVFLGWLPVSGWDSAMHKILPTLTLGSSYAAYIARLSRSSMLETLSQDYIRSARAKGLSERTVVWKHGFRVSMIPVVSYLGPAVAGLLAGSFVTETIFGVPGIGRFYVQAAFNRDYTMIMGTTILLATACCDAESVLGLSCGFSQSPSWIFSATFR